jgi:hypothetical protein
VDDSETVHGTARAVARHREDDLARTLVVTFGLERVDASGAALPPVLVEFRGGGAGDRIDDGDVVDVTGSSTGETLEASRIINHTRHTQLGVSGGRIPFATMLLGGAVVVAVIAIVVTTVVLLSGSSRPSITEGGAAGGADRNGTRHQVVPVSVTAINFGGRIDNPDDTFKATDGRPETSWPTDPYPSPDSIPDLRAGVGLLCRFEWPVTITSADIDVASTGTEVQLRSSSTPVPTVMGETVALTDPVAVREGSNEFVIDHPRETWFLLVLITRLGRSDNANKARIAEITFYTSDDR